MLVAHAIRNIFSKAILRCTTFRYRRVYALQMHSSLEKRLGAAHGTCGWVTNRAAVHQMLLATPFLHQLLFFTLQHHAETWMRSVKHFGLVLISWILNSNRTIPPNLPWLLYVCGFCTAGISQKSRWHLGWVQSTMNLSSFLIFPARRCSKYSSKTWQFLLRNDTGCTNDLVRKNLILPSWRIINIKDRGIQHFPMNRGFGVMPSMSPFSGKMLLDWEITMTTTTIWPEFCWSSVEWNDWMGTLAMASAVSSS